MRPDPLFRWRAWFEAEGEARSLEFTENFGGDVARQFVAARDKADRRVANGTPATVCVRIVDPPRCEVERFKVYGWIEYRYQAHAMEEEESTPC